MVDAKTQTRWSTERRRLGMLVQRNIPAFHTGLGEWAKTKLGEERFAT
jgi:hypothetical protein